MEATLDILARLETKLENLQKKPITKKVVVGFDGFIDSIRKVIHHRDSSGVHYYKTLGEFSERIHKAAGKSGQVEIDVHRVKPGGNAPILSSALGMLGVPTTCIGSTDHTIFNALSQHCEMINLISPGKSEAIEFDDGKIILSDLSVFENYNWNYVKQKVGLDKLRKIFSSCDFVAMVDWANLVHAEDIWDGVISDILIPSGRRNYMFLFDLCDPSRKAPHQVDDILDVISRFSYCGRVTLGLNENEAMTIWSALTGKTEHISIEEAAKFLHYAMNIDCLLIHLIDRSLVFHQKEFVELSGRFVSKPKIQTGGGDNVNAGFILGMLSGFSINESVTRGMAASGSYVQDGASPNLSTLKEYVKTWKEELLLRTSDEKEKGMVVVTT